MVFESLIVDLINRYLGSYVETLNASQLKIGLLGGNAKLENVDIKANAFDDLNLPVKVLQGHIGSLTLKIPFKNLYTEPTIAELDGLYILVVPNAAVRYDENKEKQYAREAKRKELREIEESRARQSRSGSKDESTGDSFGEKLAAQIVKNLQIDIKNIHVRYEDGHSIPGQIFSLGVTLSGLMFQTCDPDKRPVLIRDESIREFYKYINLTSLGIYWNHNSSVFSDKARGPLRVAMRSTIASPENPKSGFNYLVNPISSTAMLHVHMRPEETGFTVPQLDLSVDFTEIDLSLSLYQYHDVTSFLDATDRMITQNKYRKYRPEVPLHGNYNIWWKYAYISILEEFIRRRRKMWSWDHIKKHRKASKDYIMLWTKQLRGEKINQEQQKLLETCEDSLDVFNIVLCRQQAELQHNQSKAKRTPSRTGSGFFGWFSRSSSNSEPSSSRSSSSGGSASLVSTAADTNDLVQRLQSEMTREEKARLYAAINYSEGGVSVGKFPTTYVSSIIKMTLRQLSFTLVDDQLSDPRILKLAVNKLTADVKQRAGDQAVNVKLRLDSLEALGARPSLKLSDLTKSSTVPVLITSRVAIPDASTTTTKSEEPANHLLSVDFEKNPLDRRADQSIRVRADPLQFVYDAETINKIVHFLAPPKDIRLQELSSTVLSSLEDVKEVTISGLRHLASRRAYTEVQVDVKPSYFILPDTGVFRNNCRLLLIDLGSLTVRSMQNKPKQPDPPDSGMAEVAIEKKAVATNDLGSQRIRKTLRATFEELKEGAYDKYEVLVSSVQVIMVEQNEDWRLLRAKDQSPSHILRPLGIQLNLKRCLLHNDVNLPKLLVDGCLPVFRVDLTDQVLKSLFELISNVPFPEPDKRLTTPENPSEVLKDAIILPSDRAAATRDVLRAARRLDRSDSESTGDNSWFSETLDEVQEEEEDDDDAEDLSDDRVQVTGMEEHIAPGEQDDVRTRANKNTRRQQREAALQLRRRANLIDVKAEFVIRTIQVQILKREQDKSTESGEDAVILSFMVHEVGTHIMKRRWDQELHAHIGTLSVAVPHYIDSKTKEPVCLAKTRRHVEGHHLLAMHLLVAEKSAPDFETRYNNTRHHLRCEFKALELCVHQEATLLLIEFFNHLLHDLTIPTKSGVSASKIDPDLAVPAQVQWAAKIGDKEGLFMAQARAELEASTDKQLPDHVTAAMAIESHIARKQERRNIRLDAASAAIKSGKTMVIRELNITQWLVNATLDKVKLTLCSDSMTVLSTKVHGLRLDVQTTYSTLELSAILSEISVTDQIESTDYRKILWVDPAESIIALQLTHFAQGTEVPEHRYDPDKVDMALSLQLGKLHTIFLYHFVMRVVDFMNAFQQATQAMLNKVHELSDAAVQQVQQAVSQAPKFRLGLNITAQAPVIYMPQHSFSTKALMIDFGQVTFSNRFELVTAANPPSDASSPIPEPGIILEHTEIRLDNLRLSRAVLSDAVLQAEKPIVRPNDIVIYLRRNMNPDSYPTIPLLTVDGGLTSIHVSVCQGDYQVIQEVLLDNFAEVPPPVQNTVQHLTQMSSENSSDSVPLTMVHTSPPSKIGQSPTTQQSTSPLSIDTGTSSVAVRFNLKMGAVTLEMFTGEHPITDWGETIPVDLKLALCSLTGLGMTGQTAMSGASEIEVHLQNIELTDTRPDANKKITKVLDRAPSVEGPEELIYVKFTQDENHYQKVAVNLRSIHLCASMDYLLALADFHLKSSPRLEKKTVALAPITESGKRKRRDDPTHSKPHRRPVSAIPTKYPNNVEVQVNVGEPELVIVEDIYDPNSNSLKLTAAFHMQYTMTENVVIMDAALKNLIMVACPYTENVGSKFAKEIISRCELNFYSKQPINGSLQGSLYLESLLVNINPGTIQLLSHIASSIQVTSAASAKSVESPLLQRKSSSDRRVGKRKKVSRDDAGYSFWDPVPLEELDLPYLRESETSEKESKEGPAPPGCDVSKVLEQMEERRVDREDKDIIVMRLQTVRIVLESQVGTKSVPMLALESSLDGEVISPSTCLELKVTLDMSLSYYNDALNQWEQILETLPDDGDRMWSIQFEFSTTNMEDLMAVEDLEEVGCLQTSTNTILLVSRDNLELTLSKSALDMLTNLGRTFEAAYKQQLVDSDVQFGGQFAAPYRIQNRTGWPLVLRLDSPLLRVMDVGECGSTCHVSKQFTSTGRRRLSVIGTVKETDAFLHSDDSSVHLLKSDEEIGYWEPTRHSQKTLTLRALTDRAPHYSVWIAWSESTQPKALAHPEAVLLLNSSGNTMLQLPKPTKNQSPKLLTSKDVLYPVIAQVSTYLGMRVISLRSTVQVVNDTAEALCIFSRVAPTSQDNRPGLLASLNPGEIYALPVDVVNSTRYTGIYVRPHSDTAAMSDHPAYWPEAACAPTVVNSGHDLIYLTPIAERSTSFSIIGTQTQQKMDTLSSIEQQHQQQQQSRTCDTTKPHFDWPVQLMQCHSNKSSTACYYNVIILTGANHWFGVTSDASAHLQQLSAAVTSSRETVESDFLMVIRNAIVLHNQLPIAINYVVAEVSGELEAGGHCALRTVRPTKSSIDIWFDYDSRVYRGKLDVCNSMEELTVCVFESREGYELLTLHLGLRNATNMGQTALTLYAPYWMINKTGKDLTYKATDDSEVVHPASFRGALLYSSLAKSVFGKRKTQSSTLAVCHTSSEEEPDATAQSQNDDDLVELGQSTLSLQSHGTTMTPNESVSSKSWWKLSRTATKRPTKKLKKKQTLMKSGPKLQFTNKSQASLRVDDSQWSDKFSLDTVGSSGRVICKTKNKTSFEIGVKIDLSSSGLTKIVTLLPYLMIVNKANIDLECSEADLPGDNPSMTGKAREWIYVPAGEAVPFWPQASSSNKMLLRCRVNPDLVTDAFPYYESHSLLMKLPGKYIGVFVEVETTEEATVIILQLYQEGMALVRLVNHLGDCQPVFFQQRGVDQVHKLEAGMSVMYAWDCARSERELVFYCNKNDRQQSNRLTMDCVEEFFVNDTKAYWVSFLWNMQRVLLFTQDLNAAKNARLSADLEKIEQEIIVSLQSIGLSLVDNCSRAELAYLSVTSSGVRWSQVKRGNRLKPLKAAVSESLERAYTTYANQLRAGEPTHGLAKLTDVGRPMEVDFNQMMMIQPDQCELRRAFEPGVFLQYKTSPSQMQLHGKIFRVQLDNQKMDCTFPVVLAPYPQPKSVSFDSGPKPLVELSAIVARTADPGSFRFKYFRVLVQEMQLRLDQGFLTDIVCFFGSNVSRVPEEEAFKRDYQLIRDRLIDSPVVVAHLQEGQRSVFDNLHISPIKMHMSFSLTGSTEGKSNAFPSEVLNLFLQSLGVVLTDVQDVVFKLAYFERQACIMTVNQMMAEMTRHYVSQGIRQMYVLVLGLDVLGNPFGVLRGMAQGVEDLFYEPVKGAVLGPEEFAEGVALGVKSLFGHAVGGAAGAVSRITGTIGKGVAALTLDEDYKRRRREQLSHQPENFGAGLAQGGRGLVMGFLHGVTGVFTKPVEGARKEGVEGFFKGVGKGLVGAVTRPVSGVVDFASSSFEGIRRFADTVEEVGRMRPPRYLRMDGVIRPYERREAEGHLILRKVDKNNNYGQYIFHAIASRGNHVLLLTTSDLLLVDCIDLLGTWTVSWQTRLEGLDGVPVVNRTGILITLKEKQRKLFQAGQQTKQVDCTPVAAMTMAREIDAALSKIEGRAPTATEHGSQSTTVQSS